MTFTWARSFLH